MRQIPHTTDDTPRGRRGVLNNHVFLFSVNMLDRRQKIVLLTSCALLNDDKF